jgi:hypothetical protein
MQLHLSVYLKAHNIVKIKKTSLKTAYHITDYSIFSRVL